MSKKSPNAIDVFVGSRVRMRRKMLGMSMEKLAEPLDITWQQHRKTEIGTNRITAGRLRQIAGIFGVTESFFFDGAPFTIGQTTPDAPTPAVINEFLATTDGLTIATNFGKIQNPKLRRHLADIIKLAAVA